MMTIHGPDDLIVKSEILARFISDLQEPPKILPLPWMTQDQISSMQKKLNKTYKS